MVKVILMIFLFSFRSFFSPPVDIRALTNLSDRRHRTWVSPDLKGFVFGFRRRKKREKEKKEEDDKKKKKKKKNRNKRRRLSAYVVIFISPRTPVEIHGHKTHLHMLRIVCMQRYKKNVPARDP